VDSARDGPPRPGQRSQITAGVSAVGGATNADASVLPSVAYNPDDFAQGAGILTEANDYMDAAVKILRRDHGGGGAHAGGQVPAVVIGSCHVSSFYICSKALAGIVFGPLIGMLCGEALAEVLIGTRHAVVPLQSALRPCVQDMKSLGLVYGREHGDGDRGWPIAGSAGR
jgi:hypothetical protein